MNILIVDDDKEKMEKVVEVVSILLPKNEYKIFEAGDRVSAIKILRENQIDIAVLDLLLPLKSGFAPDRDGGEKLLREIAEMGDVLLPWHIIGLTAYDEIKAESSPVFMSETWAVLKYDLMSTEWIELLKKKLNYLFRVVTGPSKSPRRPFEVDVAIVTALRSEFDAVIKYFDLSWEPELVPNDKSAPVQRAEFKNVKGKPVRVLVTHATEMGLSAAAVAASKVILNYCPKLIVIAGITAGVREHTSIGDVLIGDPVWDYSNGKLVEGNDGPNFLAATAQQRIDSDLVAQFRILEGEATSRIFFSEWKGKAPTKVPKVRIGPVASGSMVVAHEPKLKEISKIHRKLLGVDMEVYAVYLAASSAPRPRPMVFSAKAVCDFADPDKSDDYQEFAAYMSARTIGHIVNEVIDLY